MTKKTSTRRSSKRLNRNSLGRSPNQIAQDEGDTAANEARRIREGEASIHRAWRQLAYDEGESAVTSHRLATMTGLPAAYCRDVCERVGHILRANSDKPTREEEKALKEYAEGLAQPFCACGRRWADCDGSRAKCRLRPLQPNSARSGWSKKFKIVGVETLRSGTYKVYADVDQDDHFSVIVYPAGPMQVLSERHGKLLEDDLTEKQRKQVYDAVRLRPNAPAVIEKAVKAGRLHSGSLGCRFSDQQKLNRAWRRALAAVERAYPNTDAVDQVIARVEQLGPLTPMPGKDI